MADERDEPRNKFQWRVEGGKAAAELNHTARMVRDSIRPLRGGPVCRDYAELPWKQRALIDEVGGITAGILAGKITEGTPVLRESIHALLSSIDDSLASQQSADSKDYLEKVAGSAFSILHHSSFEGWSLSGQQINVLDKGIDSKER
jgi:hypothetical protein